VGKVNNLGKLSICPDIYLSLEGGPGVEENKNSSSRGSFRKGASSSKKTDTEKKFHNRCLDSAFLAPEALFSKFSELTAAMDVWSVGMVLFSLLFGKKPESFYQAYRKWLKNAYGKDVEFQKLPSHRPPSPTSTTTLSPSTSTTPSPSSTRISLLRLGSPAPCRTQSRRSTSRTA